MDMYLSQPTSSIPSRSRNSNDVNWIILNNNSKKNIFFLDLVWTRNKRIYPSYNNIQFLSNQWD
jgi:hypothetical protein